MIVECMHTHINKEIMRVLSIQVAKLRVNYSLVGFPTFHERRNDLLFIYLCKAKLGYNQLLI